MISAVDSNIIWGMSRACLGQHLGHIVNNRQQSMVLHASVMPFLRSPEPVGFYTGIEKTPSLLFWEKKSQINPFLGLSRNQGVNCKSEPKMSLMVRGGIMC